MLFIDSTEVRKPRTLVSHCTERCAERCSLSPGLSVQNSHVALQQQLITAARLLKTASLVLNVTVLGTKGPSLVQELLVFSL